MGAEDFKHGVFSILLAFALVFSMISVAPLASPGDLIYDPSGENIEVAQGSTFLIRHTLEFNQPEDGAYSITMAWLNYDNLPSENLTFVSASAIMTSGPNVGEYQQADVTLSPSPAGEDTRWTLLVMRPVDNKDPRDGQFNVDITLGAYGVGGVPHIPGDHVIPSQFGGIIIVEKYPESWNRDPITIRVLEPVPVVRGVEVAVEPEFKDGLPCTWLEYTVTVTNTGNVDDNYDLRVSDNAGWGDNIQLENITLAVPASENRKTTLSVHIPDNAIPCTKDNITVTATSTENSQVSAENSCIAHVTVTVLRDVEVSISPENNGGHPEKTLIYEVTVMNKGNVEDTYNLEVSDNAVPTWEPTVSPTSLTILPNSSGTATLSVVISEEPSGTEDNITVAAISQADPIVRDNDTCIARVVIVFGVEVSISPENKSGLPGETLTYTVTVTNEGNVADRYNLEASDNADPSWDPTVSPTSLLIVAGGSDTATLSVTIPDDASFGTEDEITVTATSITDPTASDSASCIAFVPVCGVDVIVEPKHQRGTPSTWLTFLVSVHNTGNIEDNYLLSIVPDGWPMENINLENDRLENVKPCETKTTNLYVHIPENAMPRTHKEIVVVAESKTCHDTDNDNVLIQVVSKYLHSLWGLIDLENSARFMNSPWHELYPNYCDNYILTRWEDTGEPYGVLSPSDQIEMKDNETGEVDNYHVKDVTVTILISKKPENIDNMYLEFEGGFENMEDAITQPVGTQWHEIWPVFSRRFRLEIWEDKNDDGVLGPSDQIFMMDKDTGEMAEYHVDEVATDLVLCKKPLISVKVEVEPGFKEDPPCTWLEYTVTVTNTGEVDDNYDLTLSDNAGWGDDIQLDPNTLTVPVGEYRTTTLRVHIPDNAIPSTEDNIIVTATSQADPNVSDSDTCIAHATIGKGVKLSISPPYQENLPGGTLSYIVTVFNTGNVEDNYALENFGNEGWTLTLDDALLTIPPWESRTTTLGVTIPTNAVPCTEDNITVKATSTENAEVSAENSCVAHVIVSSDVNVSISPEDNSGPPGETLTYTVTVKNTGNVEDTYNLENIDNAGWELWVSPTSLTIPPNSDGTATLSVVISEEPSGTEDEITITATSSTDPMVSDNATCIASVFIEMGVEVSISPEDNSGPPGKTLTYTVTITNKGNVDDRYNLENIDNADPSWNPTVSPTSLLLAAGATGEAALTVIIPDNASPGAEDEITVTATSITDSTASDNATCIASAAIMMGVKVSISPEDNSGAPGETLTYTVTVKNTGNVEDNYDLTENDNTNWSLTLPETLTDVIPGESRTVNLSVGIPDDAENSTRDNVTVTVTSRADSTVKNSASCTAHAVAPPPEHDVQVSISPEDQRGSPEETLTFTVTVKNTGAAEDSYDLTASDYMGWGATLAENLLTIPAGGSRTTTISVTVPSDAAEDELTHITVIATSRADPMVSDSVISRAIAEGAPEEPGVEIPIPLAISVFLIGATILVIVYLLRRRPQKARGSVLRDVSFGFR